MFHHEKTQTAPVETDVTREASFVLPNHDNRGDLIPSVHLRIQGELIDAFGGYSATQVSGQWRDAETGRVYSDSSTRYTVGAVWNDKLQRRFDAIAATGARIAGQVEVYTVDSSGVVAFVGPSSHNPRAADYRDAA